MQMQKFNLYRHENQAVEDAYAMLTANVHINSSKKELRTFALTSCRPEEGKTSLAISLAISMAYSGWKVLLVDADMRKPTKAKRLSEGSRFGLSDFLAGDVELTNAICETNVKNLMYIACGTDQQNPIGLLCSVRFSELVDKTQNEFDFAFFDTPALESVVDGAIVAASVDATLFVVKTGFTSLKSIARAKVQLNNMNANILGVVLNKVKKRDYRRYFSSYNYFSNTKRFFKQKAKKSFVLIADETLKHKAKL
jgi:capsular exopolysaccharide family